VEPLLFLVHRIPYPPNKGDKIRSFNFLKHLARDYEIHLGAFVDDPADWKYESVLQELCHDICLIELRPTLKKLLSLSAILSGDAMSLPYYWDKGMANWVNGKISDENIKRVFVYSSQIAQYVLGKTGDGVHRLIDFVDVDSEKW
jgi:hypothetical protein